MPNFKEPIIQLNGNCSMYIENYKKLLSYSKQQIKIHTKCGTIEIIGFNLLIHFYSKEDIEIQGNIRTICFGD